MPNIYLFNHINIINSLVCLAPAILPLATLVLDWGGSFIHSQMEKQVAIRIVGPDGRILCHWKFVRLPFATYTYGQLWHDILNGSLTTTFELDPPCKNFQFKEAIASAALSSTETIQGNTETNVIEAVNIFGMRFFSLTVQHTTPCHKCLPPPVQQPQNAFNVMMAAARDAAENDIPAPVDDPKTNMDRLRNKVLSYFEEKGCRFPKNSGKGASSFVSRLCDILFYVDGQYSKVEAVISREKLIPAIFKQKFTGFNCPQQSKHKKRTLSNLSEKKLESYAVQMREIMQGQRYLDLMPWTAIKMQIVDLVVVIEQYCLRLRNQRLRTKIAQETPKSRLEIEANVTVIKSKSCPVDYMLSDLDKEVSDKDFYVPVAVREFLPTFNRRRVHELINELIRGGLRVKSVHYVHHIGGNKPSLHFIWKVGENDLEGELINKCNQVIRSIESEIPVYERRITKKQFMYAFGFIGNPVALRAIFKELTGDQSAPANLNQSEIDKRFTYAMLSEDPGIVVNLRHLPPEKKKDSFRDFFGETERYLSEEIGVAVQERRHGQQLYLAKAISLKDLHQRVTERVPPGTNIPSVKWMRYQFQPLNPRANTAKYYKASMEIKMMVQKRQVRLGWQGIQNHC